MCTTLTNDHSSLRAGKKRQIAIHKHICTISREEKKQEMMKNDFGSEKKHEIHTHTRKSK